VTGTLEPWYVTIWHFGSASWIPKICLRWTLAPIARRVVLPVPRACDALTRKLSPVVCQELIIEIKSKVQIINKSCDDSFCGMQRNYSTKTPLLSWLAVCALFSPAGPASGTYVQTVDQQSCSTVLEKKRRTHVIKQIKFIGTRELCSGIYDLF